MFHSGNNSFPSLSVDDQNQTYVEVGMDHMECRSLFQNASSAWLKASMNILTIT